MEKIRLHSYTYGCFLVSGAEVVQFLSTKTSIPCIFYSCLNFYLKKREGEFLATTICPLVTKNLHLLSPVGAQIKKLILDPVGPVLPMPMILLPLCPESLMLKNPQRHKIIHEMHLLGHKKRFFGRISCSCDFCDCYLKMHI